jgi:hypothetical protein
MAVPVAPKFIDALRGIYNRRDPYYNDFMRSGDGVDWATTPAIGGPAGYLEQNQDAAFTRWMAQNGVSLSDMSPRAQFIRDQFKNTQTGFKTALASNPFLQYQGGADSYLGKLDFPKLVFNFLKQSPRQRGLDDSRYGGPMRTIADV